MKVVKYFSIVLISSFLFACAGKQVSEEIPPLDFVFITAKPGDTVASLAEHYLGAKQLAWRIEEFNGITRLGANEKLIIPLQPWRRGGLTAGGYQLVPVLSYHNFTSGNSKDKLTVSSANFVEQLNYLQSENFHVLTLDQFYAYLEFDQLPEKSVVITIDDGWISSYKVAYPLLKQFGFSGTLFVPTNFIHRNSKRTLSWEKIREMVSDDTIDIQCHTKSHKDLTEAEPDQSYARYIQSIAKEVISSRDKIHEKTGATVTALAYPYGSTNPVVMAVLQEQGYRMGFTVNRRGNPFFVNNMRINRSMIFGTYGLHRFSKELATFQDDHVAIPEPIDTLTVLAKLNYSNPSRYEEKKQWRTALLAWKMRRDWLIAINNGNLGQDFIAGSAAVSKNPIELINAATKKVRDLTEQVKSLAESDYIAGKQHIDSEKKRKLLLRTLLFDPEHKAAFSMLKYQSVAKQLQDYSVQGNDTFSKIARKLYHDSTKGVLIPLFNPRVNHNQDLMPAMKLVLPKVSAIKINKVPGNSHCHVKLTKSAKQMAEDYYVQANDLLSHDKIDASIEKLQTAICLNPNFKKAQEMLEMLKLL